MKYFSKSRVETFSDGVFAIIITLLVLEIRLPEMPHSASNEVLGKALMGLLPKVLSWVVSFLIVCVIWVNHHRLFHQLREISHAVFWLNANLLLWCSFIPFPTSLAGSFPQHELAFTVFGCIMALMAGSFSFLRWYLLKHPEQLNAAVDQNLFKLATIKSLLFGPVLYLLGALLAWVHPAAALFIYIFIPLYFIFSPIWSKSSQDEENIL